MDETSIAQLKGREFVAEVAPKEVPVPMELYIRHLGAKLKVENDMEADESGTSFVNDGKLCISVNGNDSAERRRFTICHEIAHFKLKLGSDHKGMPQWSPVKRTLNEVCCDIYATELLLPWHLFSPYASRSDISFAALEEISEQFEASLSATGSRFASMSPVPCAFVLVDRGLVKHATRSPSLRESKAWIQPKSSLAPESVSARLRAGKCGGGCEEVDPDLWFSDWTSGGALYEEARHFHKWDQTLTLLWGDEEDIQAPRPREEAAIRDDEYRPLDGILPWRGRSKRK